MMQLRYSEKMGVVAIVKRPPFIFYKYNYNAKIPEHVLFFAILRLIIIK